MPVETTSLFSQVIQEHLELKRRNSELDQNMPLDKYETQDPFENHPLFKTEEQARLEETLDGSEPAVVAHVHTLTWPGEDKANAENGAAHAEIEDSLWGRESRDFDWGD